MIKKLFLCVCIGMAAPAWSQENTTTPAISVQALSARITCPCECNLTLALCETDDPYCVVRGPLLQRIEGLIRVGMPAEEIVNTVGKRKVSPEQEAICQARRDRKFQILSFYEEGSPQSEAMAAIVDQAEAQFKDKARIVRVNINDRDNSELARMYRIWQAPTVLVMAPNGVVTGGYQKPVTLQDMARAFVSPTTVDIIGALQQGKVVFLLIQNEQTESAEDNLKVARDVADILNTSSTAIEADPRDTKEQHLLQQVAVSPDIQDAVTLVISPGGGVAERFSGPITTEQLLTSFKKVLAQKSGCGSSCGG